MSKPKEIGVPLATIRDLDTSDYVLISEPGTFENRLRRESERIDEELIEQAMVNGTGYAQIRRDNR